MKKRKKMIWLAGMLLICGMVLSLIFQNRILYGIQSPYAALMERDGDRILAQKKGEKKTGIIFPLCNISSYPHLEYSMQLLPQEECS